VPAFATVLALLAAQAGTTAAPATPPAQAAPAGGTVGPARTFTPRDVFALSRALDAEVSPNGRQVAYTRATGDVMIDGERREIWIVDAATGRQRPLGVAGSSRPRWSPDGTRLAFAAKGPEGRAQIWVHHLANGASAALAPLPEMPGDIAWSPDQSRVALVMFVPGDGATLGTPIPKPEGATWAKPIQVIDRVNFREDGEGLLRPGYSHLFVVSADGGAARQLTFGPYDVQGGASWTADGRSILISSNRTPDRDRNRLNTEVFAVDAASGALSQLTRRNGPDGEAQASPDGWLIAYTGFDDKLLGYQNSVLSVMNADGSDPRAISTGLDRSVSDPRWARDGRSVYVRYDDRGTTRVARIALDGRVTPVAEGLSGGHLDRPYTGGSYSVARDGTLAFTAGDAQSPPELAVSRGGRTRRLTALNRDLFQGKALAPVTKLPVRSSADGLEIDAWMMTPPDYQPGRRYPTILEIHGGPFSAYGPVWSSDDQLYAAAGYVVVYANPRGSTSYGEAFANRIHHNYPSQDYDDLMSAVDAAIASGHADPDNLFVTGGSGGGLLTAWIVGKTDRFRAAVSQKPVINWTSQVLTTDGYSTMGRYWFGKMPWEDQAQYWRRSPLSLVGNVKTPTAVLVGEDDQRTPPSEAEQYYAALQIREVPTALIRVPSASHGSLADRPSQLTAEIGAILAWFDRYRKK